MSFSALTPQPCPSEIECSLSAMPFLTARALRYAIGSAPGESTKMIGVTFEESAKQPSRSNGGDSMNLAPSSAFTKFLIAKIILPGLKILSSSNFQNQVSLSSQIGGIGIRWGSSDCMIDFQITLSDKSSNDLMRFLKLTWTSSIPHRFKNTLLSMQSIFCSTYVKSVGEPLRKNDHSSMSMSALRLRIEDALRNE